MSSENPFETIAGLRLAAAASGLKSSGAPDLVLVALCEGANTAAVFTRNAFCAAPIVVSRDHLRATQPRALLINSGNANAGTGAPGLEAAAASCAHVARLLDVPPDAVLVFSTGVIGEPLAVDRIADALPAMAERLDTGGWPRAARAIMTTDTRPKLRSRRISCSRGEVVLTGIAKGAGMIKPNMATMLAFLATDASVAAGALGEALESAVADSFNSISVDGDTSTNDACTLTATGASGVIIERDGEDWSTFVAALDGLCAELAMDLVRDAEGATKFITIDVCGGTDRDECRRVAYTIAESPLVKTAMFASDANWGRILAAVGRAGVEQLDVQQVDIHLGDVQIVAGGGRAPDYREQAGQAAMAGDDIALRVELGRGEATARIWTCDLSHGYVTINAEYRT